MFNGAAFGEPPVKRFKGDGKANGVGKGVRSTGEPQEEGEVRFRAAEAAQRAVQHLNQSLYLDKQISVALDPMSPDGTKVVVTNMPAGIAWQELKDHFGQVGEVHYANIGRTADIGGGKGFGLAEHGKPCVGEVRYNTREEATQAMHFFDGQLFKGVQIRVKPDLSSSRQTKILVFNTPVGTDWTELKAHFESAGQVLFAGIDCAVNKGKGKGKDKGMPFDAGGYYDPGTEMLMQPNAHAPVTSQWDVKPHDIHGQVGANAMGAVVASDPTGVVQNQPVVCEVRFIDAAHAMQAITLLNGSRIGGAQTISVVQDRSCRDGSRVLVFGAEGTPLPTVKEHFDQAGQVSYCGWKGAGKGKGIVSHDARGQAAGLYQDAGGTLAMPTSFRDDQSWASTPGGQQAAPLVGEVRFEHSGQAHQACTLLSGSVMGGATITVVPDGGCKDGSRVLVLNVPDGFSRHAMKDFFEQVGNVQFAGWKGKGKGFKGHREGFAAAAPPMQATAFSGGRPSFGDAPRAAAAPTEPYDYIMSQVNAAAGRTTPGAVSSTAGAVQNDPYGGGPPPGAPVVSEVRFMNAEMASHAIAVLNQSQVGGVTISVVRDGGCRDGSRVLVFGLPSDFSLHVIRDHFDQAGQVSYCGWKGGGKGIGKSFHGKKGGSGMPIGFLQ